MITIVVIFLVLSVILNIVQLFWMIALEEKVARMICWDIEKRLKRYSR